MRIFFLRPYTKFELRWPFRSEDMTHFRSHQRPVNSAIVETRDHQLCNGLMETGHPSTRAVNSGSGNRALRRPTETWLSSSMYGVRDSDSETAGTGFGCVWLFRQPDRVSVVSDEARPECCCWVSTACTCTVHVFRKKQHPLTFSIITPEFLGRFLYFLCQWKEK